MLFTLKNEDTSNNFIGYRLLTARQIIWEFPMRATENDLEKYLWENYHKLLKPLCFEILNNLYITNDAGEVTLAIKDKKLEKIARLITYGTGKIKGSRILTYAIK